MKATDRRRFLKLIAAGSVAIAAGGAPRARAAAKPTKKRRATPSRPGSSATPAPERSPALAKELANQRKYLADTLKKIREFELPPGSEPAFVFRPLAPKRRGRAR